MRIWKSQCLRRAPEAMPMPQMTAWHVPVDGGIANRAGKVGAKGMDGQQLIGAARALIN